jgi:uncharacterized membrane protein YeaQ/YmgE (transglycosylase-associated protein family)
MRLDENALKTVVLAVVCAGWLAAVLADIFIPGYNPPGFVHVAMMAILGSLFAKRIVDKIPDVDSKSALDGGTVIAAAPQAEKDKATEASPPINLKHPDKAVQTTPSETSFARPEERWEDDN